MNLLLVAEKGPGSVFANGAALDLTVPANAVTLGFRPEDADVAFSTDVPNDALALPAKVEAVEPVGAESFLHCAAVGSRIVVRVAGRATAHPGDELRVVAKAEKLHWFDQAGKRV
jgi:sn-glycerol 3-phosphate transport system ATP-binding protein